MALTDYMTNAAQSGSQLPDMAFGFKLSKEARFYGFGACFIVGILLTALSVMMLAFGSIAGFAVMYSLGNVLSIVSTGFLIGFHQQIKKMFDPNRLITTIIYLACIALTFWAAIGLRSVILSIIMVVIQSLALLWYSLSYIPFAQDLAKSMIKG